MHPARTETPKDRLSGGFSCRQSGQARGHATACPARARSLAGGSPRRRRYLDVLRGVLLALALLAPAAVSAQEADEAQRAAQERDAKQKLDAVRAEIRALTEQQRATAGERDDAVRGLRERELALAAVAKEVHALDERLDDQQRRLGELDTRRRGLEAALESQRESLAALLRSAYAIGNHQELKLLLQQDDVAAISRVLAYHRYFQRAQVGQIDRLRDDLRELADVQASIESATAELDRTRAERSTEGLKLETERAEREKLVAGIDARLKDQGARIAALGKDEAALTELLERLRDVFADIPKQLAGAEPFASERGRLAWPLQGRIATAFGATDESGRRSSGILLAARDGTPVRAVSHGRVAFADWLRGYGLMIIVDHGDGYLSLYGCNETLLKDVGDWVDAGTPIASSGASGGQKTPGLYFELRAKGQAVDPRGWLRP
ncbi:peptidoglycan DD-metalloendopeptidase family protein [Dokdonella sp.]|uniref:murein hydrolase activator EnvC family protein n=1 Tax=Dokdonella sp. TaxID=2291710 RepID=UPI00260D357E|nr:peptidoglycan DD-metalloendopeptidase family protein [Dokdonella sp.]